MKIDTATVDSHALDLSQSVSVPDPMWANLLPGKMSILSSVTRDAQKSKNSQAKKHRTHKRFEAVHEVKAETKNRCDLDFQHPDCVESTVEKSAVGRKSRPSPLPPVKARHIMEVWNEIDLESIPSYRRVHLVQLRTKASEVYVRQVLSRNGIRLAKMRKETVSSKD